MINVFKKRKYNKLLILLLLILTWCLIILLDYSYYLPNYAPEPLKNKVQNNIGKDTLFTAWALKIVEFPQNKKSDAYNIYNKFINKGYHVYLKLVNSKYILYLGPDTDQNRLNTKAQEIFKEYKLHSVIEEYNVNISPNNTVVAL